MAQELVTICECETDPSYGVPPYKRPPELLLKTGVIPLDKPRGPTSGDVVSWIKAILGFKAKVGHCGTLAAL